MNSSPFSVTSVGRAATWPRARPCSRRSALTLECSTSPTKWPWATCAMAPTTLARVAPLTPPAVHLAVVDPGVGTERRPLALQTNRGDLLVGPDNGLLGPAATALGGVVSAWRLIPERVRLTASLPANGLSSTFHGRDLFAPAAALLACGSPMAVLAEPIPAESLTTLAPALLERLPDAVRTEVVEVDRFGNVALSLRPRQRAVRSPTQSPLRWRANRTPPGPRGWCAPSPISSPANSACCRIRGVTPASL